MLVASAADEFFLGHYVTECSVPMQVLDCYSLRREGMREGISCSDKQNYFIQFGINDHSGV